MQRRAGLLGGLGTPKSVGSPVCLTGRPGSGRTRTTSSAAWCANWPRRGPPSPLLAGAAGGDGTGFVGEDDGLDAVPEAELGEQVGDVGLDRGLAYHQVPGDLEVGAAAGQQQQDVSPGRRANAPMSPRVTDGTSSSSPAAATRTAAIRSARGASLSRKPLAPARSASYT